MNTKRETILKILNIIDKKFENQDIENIIISQDKLKQPEIIEELRKIIPELKQHYNSNMLNCLHKNSLSKQKFPAINLVRQILKCNNYKLTPFIVSNGYDKTTGKKIVLRKYTIIPLNKN